MSVKLWSCCCCCCCCYYYCCCCYWCCCCCYCCCFITDCLTSPFTLPPVALPCRLHNHTNSLSINHTHIVITFFLFGPQFKLLCLPMIMQDNKIHSIFISFIYRRIFTKSYKWWSSRNQNVFQTAQTSFFSFIQVLLTLPFHIAISSVLI